VTQRLFYLIAILLLLITGCRSTKYVEDNQYLLNKVQIDYPNKNYNKSEVRGYIRQSENVTILGFWRLHLNVYNLSGRNDNKWFNKWLKKIGEPPVIYDSLLRQRSVEQLNLYLKNKGFFNATVSDTAIVTGKKKIKVVYRLTPNRVYTIGDIAYSIEDEAVRALVMADTANTLLKRGRPFDSDIHNQERERITNRLHQNGYFNFSKEYIHFLADSNQSNYKIKDSIIIVNPTHNLPGGKTVTDQHRKSTIKNIYFILGFNTQQAFNDRANTQDLDTLEFNDHYILFRESPKFKPEVLLNSCEITPGSIYDINKVERTHVLLSSLNLFRFVNIRFKEIPEERDADGNTLLECYIQLSQAMQQSYAIDLEGTNSSGNLGAAGSLKYQHNNLFKGAEMLQVRYRLASQNQFARDGKERFNTLETSVETSLTFPKFLIPFKVESFRKRYNPNTNVAIAYDYQRRPDFTRTVVSSRLTYNWKASRHVWHSVTPIDFNLVNIPKISSDFKSYIENTFLKYSYEDHLIINTNYTYIYNQQNLKKNQNFWYLKTNVETAGSLLNAITGMIKSPNADGYRDIMGIRYAQYVKSDIDLRYHVYINRANSFAYRFFAGAGIPFGNLNVLPFEKSYFVGGANSIRAWPVRGLGPGSSQGNNLRYHNQTSEMRLELNAEYRFKLFWLLEGALFADAGNIWALKKGNSEEGGLFKIDEFYKQVALGVGFGTRLDFNYFIFRIDMGLKAHDPSQPEKQRWVLANDPLKWNDLTFNFAIGYPF
jgi:outer membrane protein assembly factor BamA